MGNSQMLNLIKMALVITVGFCTMIAPDNLLPFGNGLRLVLVVLLVLIIEAIFRVINPNTYRF